MNRIQRSRQAKLPPHTLCFTRGTRFGNKYKVVKSGNWYVVNSDDMTPLYFDNKKEAVEKSVELFRDWFYAPEQSDLFR